jgi:hypothetical protein
MKPDPPAGDLQRVAVDHRRLADDVGVRGQGDEREQAENTGGRSHLR